MDLELRNGLRTRWGLEGGLEGGVGGRRFKERLKKISMKARNEGI